jgi:protein TonB
MRKLLLITAVLLIFSLKIKAQTADTISGIKSDTLVFAKVQVDPQFPGGIDKFYKYVTDNLKRTGDKGRVFIQFIVEKDGSLSNVSIPKGFSEGLSEAAYKEAIRVVSQSPKWFPGTQVGHVVRVWYTVSIRFK